MITWNDSYKLGIEEIDEQHKLIVQYINQLYIAVASGNREAVASVADQLVDYTRVHFVVEETLMRIFNYSDYDEHKAIHDDIIEKVSDYRVRLKTGGNVVGFELIQFLKDWLMDHINEEDRQYVDCFIAAGAKPKWYKRFW